MNKNITIIFNFLFLLFFISCNDLGLDYEDYLIKRKAIVSFSATKDEYNLYKKYKPYNQNEIQLVVQYFDLFLKIVPFSYRKNIRYFYVFEGNDILGEMGGYFESSFFYLGLASKIKEKINKAHRVFPAFKLPVFILIHELGHYFFQKKENFYTNPSVIKKITKDFSRFSNQDSDFVSRYAKENLNEDLAESFAYFVLAKNKPVGKNGAEQKLLLFYKYEEMLEIRNILRKNMQQLGLYSTSSPTKWILYIY